MEPYTVSSKPRHNATTSRCASLRGPGQLMEGWDGWWLLWTFHKVSAVHVMLWTSELLWTSLFLASQKAWSWKSTRFGTSKVEIRTFLDSDHLVPIVPS